MACIPALAQPMADSPPRQAVLTLIGRYAENQELDAGMAEIVAWHQASHSILVINAKDASVDVLDASMLTSAALDSPLSASNLSRRGRIQVGRDVSIAAGSVNSVAVSGFLMAVAVEHDDKQADGVIAFYTLDGDGDHDAIVAFGARSFSIWDADSGEQVFDSGDDFERITAEALGTTGFNATDDENGFDDRSDDKGPEPEALAVGEVGGRRYAFIGLERTGGIMVYEHHPAVGSGVRAVRHQSRLHGGHRRQSSAGWRLGAGGHDFHSRRRQPHRSRAAGRRQRSVRHRGGVRSPVRHHTNSAAACTGYLERQGRSWRVGRVDGLYAARVELVGEIQPDDGYEPSTIGVHIP